MSKRLKDNTTPREAAYNIALGWLQAAYENRTGDLDDLTANDTQRRAVKRQLAVLHNRLLEQSPLDGMPLDDNIGTMR